MSSINSKDVESEIEDSFPKKGEKLFKEGKDPKKSAVISWFSSDNKLHHFWNYVEGYKTAGDMIIDGALREKDNFVLDTTIFPAVFCYRQHIELSLKCITIMGETASSGEYKGLGGHDLKALWCRCKKILVWYGGKDPVINNVEAYVLQFDEYDPKSESFRYPIDKDKKEIIHKERKSIDLENLRDRMEELYNFFESCQYMIISGNMYSDVIKSGIPKEFFE